MNREHILTILKQHQGSFVSGEEISQTLGISRTAVSKAIAQLREQGCVIQSATRRGYCLTKSPDRLSQGTIRPWLAGGTLGRELQCFDTIDSTNRYLKQQAMDGAPEGLVVVADQQSAGRGRLGRSFQSPPGTGIYLSLLLRPQVRPEQAMNLTACTAVAVCDGVQAACGLRPQIKWTNDLLLSRRKICGILTEMGIEGETGALQYLVVGIGMNVNQALEDFPEDLRSLAGSVAMALGHPCDRGKLAAAVINAMDEMYGQWSQGIWSVDRYRADCATIGQQVRVLRGSTSRRGVAEAVDENFGLVVRYEDGSRETIFSGEVSVRGLEGYV